MSRSNNHNRSQKGHKRAVTKASKGELSTHREEDSCDSSVHYAQSERFERRCAQFDRGWMMSALILVLLTGGAILIIWAPIFINQTLIK